MKQHAHLHSPPWIAGGPEDKTPPSPAQTNTQITEQPSGEAPAGVPLPEGSISKATARQLYRETSRRVVEDPWIAGGPAHKPE